MAWLFVIYVVLSAFQGSSVIIVEVVEKEKLRCGSLESEGLLQWNFQKIFFGWDVILDCVGIISDELVYLCLISFHEFHVAWLVGSTILIL